MSSTGLFSILSFLFSCGNSSNERIMGQLYYRSDLDKSGRIQIVDGNYITGKCTLYKNKRPKGTRDGDQQIRFYFKALGESTLQNGGTHDFNSDLFENSLVYLASPAGYFEFSKEQVNGTIEILQFKKFKKVVLKLDLAAKDDKGGKEYKFTDTVELRLRDTWVASEEKDVKWTEFDEDSPISSDDLNLNALEGKWECYKSLLIDYRKKTREKLFIDYVKFLEFRDNTFRKTREGEFSLVSLEGNNLKFYKDVSNNLIISLSDNELQITTFFEGSNSYEKNYYRRIE